MGKMMKNFTQNKTVLTWIDEMKALLTPDHVMVIDGSVSSSTRCAQRRWRRVR